MTLSPYPTSLSSLAQGVLPPGKSHSLLEGFFCPRVSRDYSYLQEGKPGILVLWLLPPPWPLGVTSGHTAHLQAEGRHQVGGLGTNRGLEVERKSASGGGGTQAQEHSRGTRSRVDVREMYTGRRKLYSLSGCPKGILPAYILLKEEAFGVCTLLPRWTSVGNPPHKTKSFDVSAHLAV